MKKVSIKLFVSLLAVLLILTPFATVLAQASSVQEQETDTEQQNTTETEEDISKQGQKTEAETKENVKQFETKKQKEKSSNEPLETIGLDDPALVSGVTSEGVKIEYTFAKGNPLSRATANSGNKIIWEYDPGYGYGTPIITAAFQGKEQYLYCIEPYVAFPTGNKYSENPMSNKHIYAILIHGFPQNVSGLREKYDKSKNQAYVATFVAINAYLGNYSRSTVEAAGDKYVNALLKLADDGESKVDLALNRTSSNSTYNATKNRLESVNSFKVTLNGTASSNTFKLTGLPSGVYAIDSSGNKVTTISFGDNFKLATNNLGYSGKFTVDINHNVQNHALYKFESSGVQDLIGFWGYDPMETLNFSQTFTSAIGNARIEKKSEDGVIQGLKFRVKGTDSYTKTFDKTVGTNEQGAWVIDNIVVGEYEVSEVETPDKYIQPETQKVKVEPNKTVTITFENTVKKGKFELYKRDNFVTGKAVTEPAKEVVEEKQEDKTEDEESDPQGEQQEEIQEKKPQTPYSLKDIEFTIYKYNSETKEIGEEVQKIVTDENGYTISTDLWFGEYIVKETKTNSWYWLMKEPIVINITAHEQVVTYEVTNEIVTGDLQIYKIDTDTKEPLKGAEFTLYADKKCTQVIEAKTVDKNGTVKFEGLKYGKYWFKETKAPKGYNGCPKVYEFEVNEQTGGNITEFTVGNKQIESVNTGDRTNVFVYVGLCFVAVGLLVGVVHRKKCKHER